MMKVMMMLLLVSIACIVHSTVSVHAVNKVVQLSALSKRVNTFRHLWNPPTVAEKPQNRLLQNGTGTSPPTPAPAQEDSFCDEVGSEGLFANETCTCEEESNLMEISEKLELLDPTDPDAFASNFNTLVGEINESYNSICKTPCEQCFTPFNASSDASKLCGLFSTENSYTSQFRMGNFTYEDILNITSSDVTGLSIGMIQYKQCIQYTSDKYSGSEICTTFGGEPTTFEVLSCNITYNDVLCNSCSVSADEAACVTADCTNVDETYGTMIDTCKELGLDGPFQVVYLLDQAENTTFTQGSCDVDVPEPTPSAPAKSPATAPSKNNAPTSNGDGSASIFPLTYIALAITSIAMFRNLN